MGRMPFFSVFPLLFCITFFPFFFFSLIFLLFPFKNHKKFTQTTITSSKTNFIRKKRHLPHTLSVFPFLFCILFSLFPIFFYFFLSKIDKKFTQTTITSSKTN